MQGDLHVLYNKVSCLQIHGVVHVRGICPHIMGVVYIFVSCRTNNTPKLI